VAGAALRLSCLSDAVPLAAIGLAALSVRLFRIDALSLWTDELFSVAHAENGLRYLWTEGVAIETTPPLYYTFLLAWISVFGDGEIAVRGLSVVFGLLVLPVIYFIGRELAGRRTGLVAAALCAGAACHIAYAQEARAYTQLMFFSAIALLGFVQVLQRFDEGDTPPIGFLLYAVGATLAVYTHVVAVFYVAAMTLCFLGYLAAARFRGVASTRIRAGFGAWTLCNAAILVVVLPQLRVVYDQRYSAGLVWMTPPSLRLIGGVLKDILFAPGPGNIGLWPGVAGLAVALLGFCWAIVVLVRRRSVTLPLFLTGLALPLVTGVMLVAVSFFRPILLPRTALWLTLPLFLLAAAAIASARSRQARGLALAIILVFETAGIAEYWRVAFKDPWRDVIATVAALADADDTFLFLSAETVPAFPYYWRGGKFPFERCRLLVSQGSMHEYLPDETGTTRCRVVMRLEDLSARLSLGAAVWLVARGERNLRLLERIIAQHAEDASLSTALAFPMTRIVRLAGRSGGE
jgi:4-amino-4-deoxy-L-arabinose transferase-like glycosyltransferase